MTTNYQWLLEMDGAERKAWFDSEHVETPNATLQGDTAALNAKYDDDSREKLEADVRKIAEAYNMDDQRHGTERFAHELYFSIIHLLDRQAAITQEQDEAICHECLKEQEKKIAELTSERDYWKLHTDCWADKCKEVEKERDELTAQLEEHREGWNHAIDGWQDAINQLEEARCEREAYREKFSKCLEYADAIHALMDEGLA